MTRAVQAVWRHRSVRSEGGMMLIEVLISAMIVTFGVLGLAKLQGRSAIAGMESQQRTHALILARDMADRLLSNKQNAAAYLGSSYGSGAFSGCNEGSSLARDRCAWDAALRGASERLGGASVGSLRSGRGCITTAGDGRFHIVVTWQGWIAGVAPSVDCARDAYGAETYRRAIVLPVRLPDLGAS